MGLWKMETIWKSFLTDLKFIYSEKTTKFCEIFTLLLSLCTVDKSKVEILQNFVAFSEYTNSKKLSSLWAVLDTVYMDASANLSQARPNSGANTLPQKFLTVVSDKR